MKIKVNGQYFEFNDTIEIEKQSKGFESVADTAGDFSYSFDVPWTETNARLLGLNTINERNKSIYKKVTASLDTDSGVSLYYGIVRVERINYEYEEKSISCSFFSGNNNWFGLLTGSLLDLDFSYLDEDFITDTITDSFTRSSGIIYPVINTGAFTERSYPQFVNKDFHPFIYVKTIMDRIFLSAGIKYDGELLLDWRFNKLTTSNNNDETLKERQNRSVFVGSDTVQTISSGDPFEILAFELTTTPYNIGDGNSWAGGATGYAANTGVTVDVKLRLVIELESEEAQICEIRLIKDSVIQVANNIFITGATSDNTFEFKDVILDEGENIYVNFYASGVPVADDVNIVHKELTVTVTEIRKTFVSNCIPDKSQADFVNEIFSMFNVLVDYDPFSRTVHTVLFKNLPFKTPVDISKYIDDRSTITDYTEFIGQYGRYAAFGYGSESEIKELIDYNIGSKVPYAGIIIDSGNEFENETAQVVSIDAQPIYEDRKNGLGVYLPKLDWTQYQESGYTGSSPIVDDGFGKAKFTHDGSIIIGDIIRVSSATNGVYNGVWIVDGITGVTFTLKGVPFVATDTATVTRMVIENNESTDTVYMLVINDIPMDFFTGSIAELLIEQDIYSGNVATGHFYKPFQGYDIDQINAGLSWGPIVIPGATIQQSTLYDDYWKIFGDVLKDPVKLTQKIRLPEAIFLSLKASTPLRLRTDKFDALFYNNRHTGYQGASIDSDIELIKLP